MFQECEKVRAYQMLILGVFDNVYDSLHKHIVIWTSTFVSVACTVCFPMDTYITFSALTGFTELVSFFVIDGGVHLIYPWLRYLLSFLFESSLVYLCWANFAPYFGQIMVQIFPIFCPWCEWGNLWHKYWSKYGAKNGKKLPMQNIA